MNIAEFGEWQGGPTRNEDWRRMVAEVFWTPTQANTARGDAMAHVRMDAMNKETLDQSVMEEDDLLNKLSQIYNVDESRVPLDPRPPNIP